MSSKILRDRNTFQREDGTPLQYTLANIKDWRKNEFEVINQLRINTLNSNHRYDVIPAYANGVPVVQIEPQDTGRAARVGPCSKSSITRRIHKNGYTNSSGSASCNFLSLPRNQTSNTYYFANNRIQHYSLNADEQFLPIYQFASEDNKKITHLDQSLLKSFSPNASLVK